MRRIDYEGGCFIIDIKETNVKASRSNEVPITCPNWQVIVGALFEVEALTQTHFSIRFYLERRCQIHPWRGVYRVSENRIGVTIDCFQLCRRGVSCSTSETHALSAKCHFFVVVGEPKIINRHFAISGQSKHKG